MSVMTAALYTCQISNFFLPGNIWELIPVLLAVIFAIWNKDFLQNKILSKFGKSAKIALELDTSTLMNEQSIETFERLRISISNSLSQGSLNIESISIIFKRNNKEVFKNDMRPMFNHFFTIESNNPRVFLLNLDFKEPEDIFPGNFEEADSIKVILNLYLSEDSVKHEIDLKKSFGFSRERNLYKIVDITDPLQGL